MTRLSWMCTVSRRYQPSSFGHHIDKFFPVCHTAFFGIRNSPYLGMKCYTILHLWGHANINYLKLFWMRHLSNIYIFNNFFSQYELEDIYLILWCILQYYFVYFASQIFQLWPLELFQLAFLCLFLNTFFYYETTSIHLV
jgi:hypothetical protein